MGRKLTFAEGGDADADADADGDGDDEPRTPDATTAGAAGFGSPVEMKSQPAGELKGVTFATTPPPPPPPPPPPVVRDADATAKLAAAPDAIIANACDSLKILCAYKKMPLPEIGASVTFAPLSEDAPSITFTRRVPDESTSTTRAAAERERAAAAAAAAGVGGLGLEGGGGDGSRSEDTSTTKEDEETRREEEDEEEDDDDDEEDVRPSTPPADLSEPSWKSPSVLRRAKRRGNNAGKTQPTPTRPPRQPPRVVITPAEEASHLETWTVAALCRCLSLENILLVLNGALLEKQMVVLCPNLGELSACVLSVAALLRPLRWQARSSHTGSHTTASAW